MAKSSKTSLTSSQSAAAVGPYSPGIVSGDLVFLSGQIALDAAGDVVGATAAEQARQALANMRLLLAEQGLAMDDVVKTTIFMTDLNDFATVNEVYASFFDKPFPARSTVQVAALPKGVKVEIEAIARS
jgi:2-iminobutanoate/2-iminopropanoate deaminase